MQNDIKRPGIQDIGKYYIYSVFP